MCPDKLNLLSMVTLKQSGICYIWLFAIEIIEICLMKIISGSMDDITYPYVLVKTKLSRSYFRLGDDVQSI